MISPANMCRNCPSTSLTYDFDKAIYICNSCKTKYVRTLVKIVEGVRIYWLGDEIR